VAFDYPSYTISSLSKNAAFAGILLADEYRNPPRSSSLFWRPTLSYNSFAKSTFARAKEKMFLVVPAFQASRPVPGFPGVVGRFSFVAPGC